MRSRSSNHSTLILLAVLAAWSAGCARKSVQSPSTVPDAPPATSPRASAPTTANPPSPGGTVDASGQLAPIYFSFDSNGLDDAARATLDRDARLLRQNPELRIVIEGHCDERGSAEYNMALGERRAQVARDYLIAAGVEPSRLRILSYGRERPFDDGHDESAWAVNRRAHLVGQ